MEETLKGSKSSKSTSIVLSSTSDAATAAAPWLDLPDGLTDLVLERLDLRHYLRFAAVCRKWGSIQSDHRLRHFPGAPPMAQSLPWILPFVSYDETPILSLSDSALSRLPLPSISGYVFSPSGGWLFVFAKVPLQGCSKQPVYRLNPVSGDRKQLVPLSPPVHRPCAGVLSAPLTDPDCMALIIDCYDESQSIRVCRVHDHSEWIKLPGGNAVAYGDGISVVFCAGKFYCLLSGWFMVIDPLFPSLAMKTLEMGCPLNANEAHSSFVMESNGEILLILSLHGAPKVCNAIKDFRMFRADFSRMMWVMMEGLGDRVLFIDEVSAFSLSSAQVGCKKNLVYYTCTWRCGHGSSGPRRPAWHVFDLDARRWINGPYVPDELGHPLFYRWFVPSLEYVHPL